VPRVVTCVLEHDGKILVLRRSQSVRTYKGLWGGVAGYVEPGEEPLQTAYKEIREEINLSPELVQLLWAGDAHSFTDTDEGQQYDWTVYPFLFHAKDITPLKTDWEHTEYRWIDPKDLPSLPTVPHFTETVKTFWRKGGWGRVEMR